MLFFFLFDNCCDLSHYFRFKPQGGLPGITMMNFDNGSKEIYPFGFNKKWYVHCLM